MSSSTTVTQNFLQQYMVPDNATTLNNILNKAAKAGESSWGPLSVVPLGVIAVGLSAINAVRYPLHGGASFVATLLNGELQKAFSGLFKDLGRSVLSVLSTAIIVICVAISIVYPKIFQYINPAPPEKHESSNIFIDSTTPPANSFTGTIFPAGGSNKPLTKDEIEKETADEVKQMQKETKINNHIMDLETQVMGQKTTIDAQAKQLTEAESLLNRMNKVCEDQRGVAQHTSYAHTQELQKYQTELSLLAKELVWFKAQSEQRNKSDVGEMLSDLIKHTQERIKHESSQKDSIVLGKLKNELEVLKEVPKFEEESADYDMVQGASEIDFFNNLQHSNDLSQICSLLERFQKHQQSWQDFPRFKDASGQSTDDPITKIYKSFSKRQNSTIAINNQIERDLVGQMHLKINNVLFENMPGAAENIRALLSNKYALAHLNYGSTVEENTNTLLSLLQQSVTAELSEQLSPIFNKDELLMLAPEGLHGEPSTYTFASTEKSVQVLNISKFCIKELLGEGQVIAKVTFYTWFDLTAKKTYWNFKISGTKFPEKRAPIRRVSDKEAAASGAVAASAPSPSPIVASQLGPVPVASPAPAQVVLADALEAAAADSVVHNNNVPTPIATLTTIEQELEAAHLAKLKAEAAARIPHHSGLPRASERLTVRSLMV